MSSNELAHELLLADIRRRIRAASYNGDDWAYHQAQIEYHKLTGEFYYEQDRDTKNITLDG